LHLGIAGSRVRDAGGDGGDVRGTTIPGKELTWRSSRSDGAGGPAGQHGVPLAATEVRCGLY